MIGTRRTDQHEGGRTYFSRCFLVLALLAVAVVTSNSPAGAQTFTEGPDYQFSYSTDGQRVDWGFSGGATDIPFYIHADLIADGYEQAILNAFDTWENSGAAVSFNYLGVTTTRSEIVLLPGGNSYANPDDAINVVSYENIGNIAGRGGLGFSGFIDSTGQLITEGFFDISISPSTPLTIGAVPGLLDVESLVLHELGHALGLNHPTSRPQAIMHGIISTGVQRTALEAADIYAINLLYPGDGPVVPSDPTSAFTALSPTRLFDTRSAAAPSGKLARGATLAVQVTGEAGVPADATAVVLNVTGTAATRNGFVTVFPTGSARPVVSSLNLSEGQTAPNMVIVPVGTGGKVSFFSSGGTHLLADVAGYFSPSGGAVSGGRLVPKAPQRLFDTRTAASPSGKLGRNGTISVQVAGQAGVPASGASAVVINLTGTDPSRAGFVTAYPSGQARPLASVLNFDGPNHTTANLAIVPLGSNGQVQFFSSGGAHLLADVVGYITSASASTSTSGLFVPLDPARVFDTRTAATPSGIIGRGQSLGVAHRGAAGVPSDGVIALSLNLTAVGALGPGYLTTYPTGSSRPNSSTLNLNRAGETRPNAAIAQLGGDGGIVYFSSRGFHLLADVNGYFRD